MSERAISARSVALNAKVRRLSRRLTTDTPPHRHRHPAIVVFQGKNRAPDCLLFYRMGDFYEMFFDDAPEAAEILTLPHQARQAGGSGHTHVRRAVSFYETYAEKLIRAGSAWPGEQMKAPRRQKNAVIKPWYTQVVRVSPRHAYRRGTACAGSSNYLASISF